MSKRALFWTERAYRAASFQEITVIINFLPLVRPVRLHWIQEPGGVNIFRIVVPYGWLSFPHRTYSRSYIPEVTVNRKIKDLTIVSSLLHTFLRWIPRHSSSHKQSTILLYSSVGHQRPFCSRPHDDWQIELRSLPKAFFLFLKGLGLSSSFLEARRRKIDGKMNLLPVQRFPLVISSSAILIRRQLSGVPRLSCYICYYSPDSSLAATLLCDSAFCDLKWREKIINRRKTALPSVLKPISKESPTLSHK